MFLMLLKRRWSWWRVSAPCCCLMVRMLTMFGQCQCWNVFKHRAGAWWCECWQCLDSVSAEMFLSSWWWNVFEHRAVAWWCKCRQCLDSDSAEMFFSSWWWNVFEQRAGAWWCECWQCLDSVSAEMFLSTVLVPDDANADNVWAVTVLRCLSIWGCCHFRMDSDSVGVVQHPAVWASITTAAVPKHYSIQSYEHLRPQQQCQCISGPYNDMGILLTWSRSGIRALKSHMRIGASNCHPSTWANQTKNNDLRRKQHGHWELHAASMKEEEPLRCQAP